VDGLQDDTCYVAIENARFSGDDGRVYNYDLVEYSCAQGYRVETTRRAMPSSHRADGYYPQIAVLWNYINPVNKDLRDRAHCDCVLDF
jgi:hypothetical protein